MQVDRRTTAVSVALALGTVLLYASALRFDFINLDDPIYVSQNFHLQESLSWKGVEWCFQTGTGGYWMPLTWLSYMLDYRLWAFNSGGYHATNILLHACNVVLLFIVLKQMTEAFWRSAMVAALFAWHPTHVESVAWIAERKDVLSGVFWFLAMWAYLKYVKTGRWMEYALVLIFFVLGMMAKPMLVTLPFVFLLLDAWPLARRPGRTWGQLIWEKVPLFLFSAAFSAVTTVFQGRSDAISSFARLHLLPRLENAVVSYGRYIEKTLWPAKLSVIYPLHEWPAIEVMAVLIFLAAVSDRIFGLRRKCPYLLVGWLWFLGTLVPMIGIVQVGTQAMADRFSYIPSIGLFIMICWGAGDLMKSLPDRVGKSLWWAPGVAGVASLALCGWVTNKQLEYWRDSGSLLSHAIALQPNNFYARTGYGIYLLEHGSFPEAAAELRKAIQIVPEFPYAHAMLGKVLYKSGRLDEAAAELRMALKLKPDEIDARNDLGSLLLEKSRPAEAASEFVTALQYAPDNPTTHCLLGKALAKQGRKEEAQAQFSEALRLDPRRSDAHE